MLNVSLEHSFNAYKISLNVSKKEVVMFNPPKKQLDHELKIKLNGKIFIRLSQISWNSYTVNKTLTWKHHINVAIKFKIQ